MASRIPGCFVLGKAAVTSLRLRTSSARLIRSSSEPMSSSRRWFGCAGWSASKPETPRENGWTDI